MPDAVAIDVDLRGREPPSFIAVEGPIGVGKTTLAKRLAASEVKVTRIATGVPMGGDLEYIDQNTLSQALKETDPTAVMPFDFLKLIWTALILVNFVISRALARNVDTAPDDAEGG